jgi:hypothetical protein
MAKEVDHSAGSNIVVSQEFGALWINSSKLSKLNHCYFCGSWSMLKGLI